MEAVHFWVILTVLIFMILTKIVLFIYILYVGSLLIKVANLLEEVRGITAEVRYIQLARIRKRPPGEGSGLMDLDESQLSYDPRYVPPSDQ